MIKVYDIDNRIVEGGGYSRALPPSGRSSSSYTVLREISDFCNRDKESLITRISHDFWKIYKGNIINPT